MSEAIKPTPGPCYADGQVVHSDAVTCIAKFGDAYPSRGWAGSDFATEAHKEANAELFAEALNVHSRTGLYPLQLVERVKELEAMLRAINEDMESEFGTDCDYTLIPALLSKALPNTVAEVPK